jgi:hypothetical protein
MDVAANTLELGQLWICRVYREGNKDRMDAYKTEISMGMARLQVREF